MKRNLVLTLVLILFMSCISHADWQQYLGPNRNATSTETGIKRSWTEEGPEVLWIQPLGRGFGGAVVSDGKVYVLDRIEKKQDVLRCLDLLTGEEEWSFVYDAPGEVSRSGSRTVPTVDGDFIYTCGLFGHVYCVNKNTHQPVWNKNIWSDFGGGESVPTWGITQNPLIYGDLLILAAQTDEAGVVAFDKMTGEVQWTSAPFPGNAGYVSPKIVTIDGIEQITMICSSSPREGDDKNSGRVIGIDPKTGSNLWTYSGWQCSIPIPNVTEIGDGRLFITGGYKAGSAMIKVSKEGDKFAVEEIYTTKDFGTHVHPPVLYEGHLYGHCTTNTRRDGMVCMDIDGNVKWKTERSPVFDKGGFILVDDLILSVDGVKGILSIIEPTPESFKRLEKADLLDTNQCWAPLALSDGKLLIRDQKQIKCVVVK